jgi:hypothetical protein
LIPFFANVLAQLALVGGRKALPYHGLLATVQERAAGAVAVQNQTARRNPHPVTSTPEQRQASATNLKLLAQAMPNYRHGYRHFPPAPPLAMTAGHSLPRNMPREMHVFAAERGIHRKADVSAGPRRPLYLGCRFRLLE